MKILMLLASALLFVFGLQAGTIEKVFYFNHYTIEQHGRYQIIRFPGTKQMGKPGQPLLPYHALSLLLPPGEVADSMEILPSDRKEIPGTFNLLPAQFSRPVSNTLPVRFVKDERLYQSHENFPAKLSGKLSTSFMNGYAFALSVFTPTVYLPADGKLFYYSTITIRIHTSQSPKAQKALDLLKSSPQIRNAVSAFAQNPDAIDSYPQTETRSDSAYQLLVVTPSQFTEAFNALEYLYLIRGIKMRIVSTDSIYSSKPAPTHKESIRNFIIQEYNRHNIEYVLLGGDVEWVPYCGFYCVVQSDQIYQDDNIPADLYYSALDGTWNDDGDDKWGEIGEDDLLPEVSVARLPFSNSEELQRMLHKIISYQDNPVTGELNRPLLAGEKLWDDPLTWGADYMDLLVGHHDDNGYTTDGINEDDPFVTLYDRDLAPAQWSGSTIMQQINQGKSFVYHAGHANTTYVMRLYSSDITDENFSQVDGVTHNFTLVNTQGCDCGAFDYEDCIAEEMVKINNFAVGFVGNSRYGWFNEGTTEGPSTHLQREFVNAIYADRHFRIGEAHKYSKIKTAPWVNAPDQHEEGAMRWCFYDCNVLSDPALGIWTEEPIPVEAEYPQTIYLNTTSIEVHVTSNGEPVSQLTCALIKDSLLYGVGYTDSLGNAEIRIDPPLSQTGSADIVVSGYNCKPVFFPINVDEPSAIIGGNLLVKTSKLSANYPNPFNSTTVIAYSVYVPSTALVELSVYNLLGQKVRQLVKARQRTGNYRVHFNAGDLPSGVYLYRLQIDGRTVQTEKMLLVR